MGAFLAYILKSAVCLAVFYLFYKLLLSRDTFHRFNRFALLSLLVLSVVLPLLKVSINKPAGAQGGMLTLEQLLLLADMEAVTDPTAAIQSAAAIWLRVILLVYVAGVLFFALRNLWSLGRLCALLRRGQTASVANYLPGASPKAKLIMHEQDIAPFSWMNYIVISRKDLDENGREILLHELAHISNRHSWDLLLADLCIFVQWFNPAAWLLKNELQNIHEYEADETVLRQGVEAKNYQMLLIKKAVGTRLYSMANSFNHSSLKKRITMMLKRKSNPWARAKYLYVLPLAALAVTAFARPEVSAVADELSSAKVNDLAAMLKTNSQNSAPAAPVAQAVPPQDTLVVVGFQSKASASAAPATEEKVFTITEKLPEYPGGTEAMMKFLLDNIHYPAEAEKAGVEGRVIVQFVVQADGSISNIEAARGIHPALDAEAVRVISIMPKWKPGTQDGKAVAVRYTVPIAFALDKDKTKTQKCDAGQAALPAPDKMPEFPGGITELMKFLAKNIRYPEEAVAAGVEGKVVVQFTVEADGSIDNINVIRGIHPACDAEAVRVIGISPKWQPGETDGKPVPVQYTIPVAFKLQKDEPQAAKPATNIGNVLVLLDGKEISSEELNNIPPADIAAVKVLKNEADIAPYGEKGKNGVILITSKQAAKTASADQMQVEGTVLDRQGNAIPGAIICIKGAEKQGTVSGLDGKFSIATPKNATLVVSYVGLKSAETKAQPKLTITLADEE